MSIIEAREKNLNKWMENEPEKRTISTLKRDFKKWINEVIEATEFSIKYDKIIPKEEFGFVYTLMNEYSAYRALCTVQSVYIRKLEKNKKKL